MWKMIIAQAALQTAINLTLVFAGPQIFQMNELYDAGGLNGVTATSPDAAQAQNSILRTVIFNSFVLLQIFNLLNSRRLGGSINVIDKIWENPSFMLIFAAISLLQAIIVQFGGQAFSTVPLDGKYWGICLLLGVLSLPCGFVVRLFPDELLGGHKRAHAAHAFGPAGAPHDIELGRIDAPIGSGTRSDLASLGRAPSSPAFTPHVLSAAQSHPSLLGNAGRRPSWTSQGGEHGGFGAAVLVSSPPPSPPAGNTLPRLPFAAATAAAVGDDPARGPREQWDFAIRAVRTELSVFRALRASASHRSPASTPSGSVSSLDAPARTHHPRTAALPRRGSLAAYGV
ncbi:hypothetical protein HK405_014319 [Cladochytrium tenue]|nr:hypothetical protein HK405_014319 [Cladochytrium tenue]